MSIFGVGWVPVKRGLIGVQSRPYPRGGSIAISSSRVEFDDCLQCVAGSAIAQGFRESVEPGGIFGLQGDEFSDGVAPAPGAAAAVGSTPVADRRQGRGAGS